MVNGQVFVQKFLIEQNVGRFTGGDAAHTIGGFRGFLIGLAMYLGVLLLGMMPWSLFIFRYWPRITAESARDESAEATLNRYLASWAAIIFVFFAISSAKLPHYILPMVPPLAILIASSVLRSKADDAKALVPRGCH